MNRTMAMTIAMAIAGLASGIHAQTSGAAGIEAPPGILALEERVAAARIPAISVPSPGELFAALEKGGQPEWAAAFVPLDSHSTPDRRRIALRLGRLIADGFLAVKAQDSRQIKNLAKELMAAAAALGLGEEVLARGGSLNGFAADFEWTALGEDLDAFHNEIALGLLGQKDEALVPLVTVGAWARSVRVAAGCVLQDFRPGWATLLRQPGVGAILAGRLGASMPGMRHDGEDNIQTDLLRRVQALALAVVWPAGQGPARAEVEAILAAADRVLELSAAAPTAPSAGSGGESAAP